MVKKQKKVLGARLPVLAWFFLSLAPSPQSLVPALYAQQPQAQSGQPIYAVNAKYVNGVGPGYWPTAGTGLTLNLSAGTGYCGSPPSVVTYAGGTLTMTASATNYVYLDPSNSCAPAANTTGAPAGGVPLATVATSDSAITSITDTRTWFQPNPVSRGSSGVWSIPSFADSGGQVFNVKAPPYNAKGDGLTDDTTAIQGAINTAKGANGGIVFLPPGTYLVSSNLDFTSVGLGGKGVTFRGANMSPATSLKWIGSSGGTVILAKSVGYSTFEDFQIDGNSLASVGIDYTAQNSIGGSQANIFRNIKIVNTIANTTTGVVHVGSATNDQVSETTFDHVDVFVPAGGNGWYQEGSQTINLRYRNSLLSGAWNYGMKFVSGDVYVKDCDFQRQSGFATVADIDVEPTADWVLLDHNYSELSTIGAPAYAFPSGSRYWPTKIVQNAISWASASPFTLIDYEQKGALTIRENSLYANGTTAIATVYVGSNADDVDITQNYFYPNQVGININGSARIAAYQRSQGSYGSVDFGPYRPITGYRFVSRSANAAQYGQVGLAYNDWVAFRNYANTTEISGLKVSPIGYNVVQVGDSYGAATAGPFTINGGTAIGKHLSATASLSPGTPGAVPGCSADVSLTVTGAAVGNTVFIGLPGSAVAGQVYSAWVDSADTVKIRWCQLSGTAASPVSGTYRADVWQH